MLKIRLVLGFRKGLKQQAKVFCDIMMSDIFLLADIQPVCGNGRQCCVQATARLEQRREGKKEEKEAGSKEKVGRITFKVNYCLKVQLYWPKLRECFGIIWYLKVV